MDEKKTDKIGKIIVIFLIALFTLVGIVSMILSSQNQRVGSSMSMSFGGNPLRSFTGTSGRSSFNTGSPVPEEPTITVSAKTIRPETIQKTVLVNGNVSSRAEVAMYPDTSGKITRVLKTIGDAVQKGEVLAYVDPSRPGSAYAASPVIATVGGTITGFAVHVGDTVGSNTAIATIGSLDDLEITVYISEKYSAYITKGLPAYVSVSSALNDQFLAKIHSISPVVHKTSRTVEVGLDLVEYDVRIKPGMFASVRVVVLQEEKTMVVPKTALKTYNADTVVYTIDTNNTAVRKIVKTGISNDLDMQIIDGLNFNDVVITAGSVTEGSLVKIAGVERN